MKDPTTIEDNRQAATFLKPRHPAEVLEIASMAPGIIRLVIRDPYVAAHAAAGQFINVYTSDSARMMPRPFGISGIQGDMCSLIFAIVGSGTADFSQLKVGQFIDILGPLGKGFDITLEKQYLLVGGGLGIPPLLFAAQQIQQSNNLQNSAVALFGYRDSHFANALAAQHCADVLSIDDSEGNVITLLNRLMTSSEFSNADLMVLSCGPHPMMKAVAHWASAHGIPSQLSLEARMGCGFGTCVVCVQDTIAGRKKVCVDGPVFSAEDLGWAV
ncbi:MAG: dihydroorotate dehydrogenase electron transfer subunit [Bifidobacterium sp.]|jgi:dihydroorotate dehydrogenase electron transfer subunit|nr:dihydroorotate dehydrogenase electron transfer subunit [Bifidobacterium sp.]MCH4174374.1 dihydroorotate dehydrogenase electron transfer subunit [Bifidobacterium sp.]